MKSLSRLVDAASALVMLTGVLYFWGYMYYAGYTEKLGVPFHGIMLAPLDYLTASWIAVIMLLSVTAVCLMLLPTIEQAGAAFGAWLLKRFRKKNGVVAQDATPLLSRTESLGLSILVATGVIYLGAIVMLRQGQSEAEKVARMAPEVLIWAPDGKSIDGRFAYLRSFGHTLLVREMSPDFKKIVGYRFFKDSTFGGYSLLSHSWTAKWKPTTETIP